MDDGILSDFIIEAKEKVEEISENLVSLENSPNDFDVLNDLFRGFHTIKGGAGFLEINSLVHICHTVENLFDLLRNQALTLTSQMTDEILQAVDTIEAILDGLNQQLPYEQLPDMDMTTLIDLSKPKTAHLEKPSAVEPKSTEDSQNDEISSEDFESLIDDLYGAGGPSQCQPSKTKSPEKKTAPPVAAKTEVSAPKPEKTVRVDTERLDTIMNMVGELVLVRNRMMNLGQVCKNENLNLAISQLDLVTANLQLSVMKTRMQPIQKIFGRFPRVVRDLGRKLDKEVNLTLIGQDTDLDKNLVEALADPLIHLIRNSIDHGIENPIQRTTLGKPQTGEIVLSARQEGDHILLQIEDDGKGICATTLKEKAVDKGIIKADMAQRLSEEECFDLIFSPGFSTKEEVSDVSGRGVGMDVVKTKITHLNGSVHINSKVDVGTQITIKVPLTLAILPTLMINVGEQVFALPLSCVNEIFKLDFRKINQVDKQKSIRLREKALPLFYLKNWLTPESQDVFVENEFVIIATIGAQRVALVVDKLLGQEEVVIKPLGALLSDVPGMAGATITGDGKVAMILELSELMTHYGEIMAS